MSGFAEFTAKTAPVPRPYLAKFTVACFEGRPDLAAPYCSEACAIAVYNEGPTGFLVEVVSLPGYIDVECANCGRSSSP